MVEAPSQQAPEPTVFVVDDDEEVLRSLGQLARSVGLNVEMFPSATKFLASCDPRKPGCLVIDVRMPDISGLELQQRLAEKAFLAPIIFLTGYAEVPVAVQAMKVGAFDFVEKPYRPQELLERIQQAIQADRVLRQERERQEEVERRFESLSPREREMLEFLVEGKTTKEIALALDISLTTVDYHRHNILHKLQVENVVQLTRLWDLRAQTGGNRP